MAVSLSEDEAAAIAAALERFLVEATPPGGDEMTSISPWQQAALLEGVGARGGFVDLEGEEGWLS